MVIITSFVSEIKGLDVTPTHLLLAEGGGPLFDTLMAPLGVSFGELRGERWGDGSGGDPNGVS